MSLCARICKALNLICAAKPPASTAARLWFHLLKRLQDGASAVASICAWAPAELQHPHRAIWPVRPSVLCTGH